LFLSGTEPATFWLPVHTCSSNRGGKTNIAYLEKKKRDLRPLNEEPVSAIVFVNCESRRKERWLAGL